MSHLNPGHAVNLIKEMHYQPSVLIREVWMFSFAPEPLTHLVFIYHKVSYSITVQLQHTGGNVFQCGIGKIRMFSETAVFIALSKKEGAWKLLWVFNSVLLNFPKCRWLGQNPTYCSNFFLPVFYLTTFPLQYVCLARLAKENLSFSMIKSYS